MPERERWDLYARPLIDRDRGVDCEVNPPLFFDTYPSRNAKMASTLNRRDKL